MLEYNFDLNKDNIVEIARGGDLKAQETIAIKYLSDDGFLDDAPDWGKALYWLKKSAENGSLLAFRRLKYLKENPEDRTFGGAFPTSQKLLTKQSITSDLHFFMSSEDELKYKKKVHERIDEKLLIELVEYCQDEGRTYPKAQCWNKIYHNYSWHTDTREFTKFSPLKAPLLFDAWNASEYDKRLRLLAQVYWCYSNKRINGIYESIFNLGKDDWHYGDYKEAISLDFIKDECVIWLTVAPNNTP